MVSTTAGFPGSMPLTKGWMRDENPRSVFSKPVNLSFFVFIYFFSSQDIDFLSQLGEMRNLELIQ